MPTSAAPDRDRCVSIWSRRYAIAQFITFQFVAPRLCGAFPVGEGDVVGSPAKDCFSLTSPLRVTTRSRTAHRELLEVGLELDGRSLDCLVKAGRLWFWQRSSSA
jgi:hypothetical protein